MSTAEHLSRGSVGAQYPHGNGQRGIPTHCGAAMGCRAPRSAGRSLTPLPPSTHRSSVEDGSFASSTSSHHLSLFSAEHKEITDNRRNAVRKDESQQEKKQ